MQNSLQEYKITFLDKFEEIDFEIVDAGSDFAAISFVLLSKGLNITDCKTIIDLEKLAKTIGLTLKCVELYSTIENKLS